MNKKENDKWIASKLITIENGETVALGEATCDQLAIALWNHQEAIREELMSMEFITDYMLEHGEKELYAVKESPPPEYVLSVEEISGAKRNALATLRHAALSCYWLGFDYSEIFTETKVTLDNAGTIFEVGESPPPLYVRRASGRYRVAEPREALAVALDSYRLIPGETLSSPDATETFLKLKIGHLEHEVFCVIFLDNRHCVIKYEEMFRGTIDGTSVYPREVVKEALACNAAAIILAHNHPSGRAEPSQADERITKRLKAACELIDVRVLDHLIIGTDKCVSLAQRGLL